MTGDIIVQSQYLRDISFELIRAPWERKIDESKIHMKNDISVSTKKFEGGDVFEVSVKITINLLEEEDTLFLIEMDYCGVFAIKNIDQNLLPKVLMVDCASLLFPFIRHIVATLTQDSGFRTVSINPVNFYEVYEKFLQNEKSKQDSEVRSSGQIKNFIKPSDASK